jgi:hypothetical protein
MLIKFLAQFLLGIFLPGLKRPERDADGLYSSNVDVRNVWTVTVSHAP